jgi:hypothetical protein
MRWRGGEVHKTLAEFSPSSTTPAVTSPGAAGTAELGTGPVKDNWQPDHGVLFTASPTLFGRIYNAFYCDGTQGRDFTKCERLSDADPFKLGVLTP